jgi:hypothetical protein
VRIGLLAVLGSFLLTGCYFQAEVESSEVGLKMPDGVTVEEVVGPGRYTDLGFYSDLRVIDVSAKQIEWVDPDLVTRDLQPIGLSLQVTYARDRKTDSVRLMWEQYRQQALDDVALETLVRGRIPAVSKEITARYTLQDMIGTSGSDQAGRSLLAKQLADLLAPQLTEIGVVLLDVAVTNIDPGQAYLDLLQQKAQVALERDIADLEQRVKVAAFESESLEATLNELREQADAIAAELEQEEGFSEKH